MTSPHNSPHHVAEPLPATNVVWLDSYRAPPRGAAANVVQFPGRRAQQFASRPDTSVFLGNAIRILSDAKSCDRQIKKLLCRAQALKARLECPAR
jgi:hypothetical protein